MSDGITTGWNHALWLLGWLLGAVGPFIGIALVLAVLVAVNSWALHRSNVRRIHREARRTGRTT